MTQPPRFVRLARSARLAAEPALAVAFVLLAAGLRVELGRLAPGLSSFDVFYPAILGAGLVGGWSAATLALSLSFGLGWLILRHEASLSSGVIGASLLLLASAGALVAFVADRVRRQIRRGRSDLLRYAEREAHYRELFAGVSESVALLEGIWDDAGRLIDVCLLEANPATLKMFGLAPAVIGHRLGDYDYPIDPDYLRGGAGGFRGQSTDFIFYSSRIERWFDVRLRPMGENRVVQLSIDITHLKRVESRQAEQFDELNHRVKNNLAAVSGMLTMQARLADSPDVREHLEKAVARIQTIGEIHTSLYEAKSQEGVELAGYLVRLCNRLSTSVVDPERVRIQVTAEPAIVPMDRAVALGLVVNELVTNATKYAYPPPTKGVIRVGLARTGERLCLSVSDEGPGMSGAPISSGLGMRLVRSLVQQSRGELEFGEGPGLTIRILLNEDGAAASHGSAIPL